MKKRKRRKKVYLISTVLIMAGLILLLKACGTGQNVTENSEKKEEVLTFAIYGDENTEKIVKQAVKSFQELNHCKVEVYCYGTEKEERTQVLGQAAGGKGFDVFYATPATLKKMWEAGEVLELDSVVANRKEQGDIFYPITLEDGKIEGKQYALPVGVEPYMLYYNKDQLELLGMENPQEMFREKRWTGENVLLYFEKLVEKTGNPALKLQNTIVNTELILQAEGGQWKFENGEMILDQKAKHSLDGWNELLENGMIEMISSEKYEECKNSFQDGGELFIIGNLSMTRLLYNADFSWDIIPFPSENSDFSNSIFTVPLIAVGAGNHQELARQFVDYYVSTLGQKLRLESGECLLPSLNMVFYTSMGDVSFPEHSNYYFFAVENGYSSEKMDLTEEEKQLLTQLLRRVK
ncbi:MAG: ABC transporter substrate-binding protein [Muricoprocola sp.]